MRLRVAGLGHGYSGQPMLFENLDFSFMPGVLIGLTGPSGSGKSTLLSIIAGHIPPSLGRVESDKDLRIGWILQNPVGTPRRTALDHLVFPYLVQGFTREEAELRAKALLNDFGLRDVADREFRQLSGGEAQRLAFACAAAANFSVLLLDEPTAQLDSRTAQSIREVIRRLVAPDRIVVVATHDMALRDRCDVTIDLGVTV